MKPYHKNIYIITGILFLVTAAVNLEMPLFKQYANSEGFGVGMIGIAFASYIGGLIPTALFFGGLSDVIGKKRVLIIALILSSCSVLTISIFPNLYALFVSRILVGSAVALSISTGSSFLSDMFLKNKETNSSSLVALSTSLGFGGGALLTSICLVYSSSITPLTYWLVLFLSFFWLILAVSLPESKVDPSKKLLRLPLFPTGGFQFNISIALFWGVTGVVISIIPSQIAKFNLGGWSGLSLFLINGTGALFLPLAKRISVHRSMIIAYILLPIGLTMLTLGSIYGTLLFLLLGCSIVGAVCYGFGYFGTLSGISQLNPEEKPRVVAGYLLYAYVGFGIPSIIVGFISERYGIERTLIGYSIVTIVATLLLLIQRIKRKSQLDIGIKPKWR